MMCLMFVISQATALDANKKTVSLSNGTVLNFDSVLIATGGKYVHFITICILLLQ